MTPLNGILSNRKLWCLAVGLLLAGAGASLLVWKSGVDVGMAGAAWRQFENFLIPRPWLLFLALVILPSLPVPTSLLLVLAGTVWRDRPVAACGVCLVALGLNMSWTYWLAAGFGRKVIIKLLDWMGMRVPQLREDNQLLIILLIRLTPGFPFFAQNYVLGLLQAPFPLYLGVSLACNGFLSIGVVLGAAGLADRNWTPLIAGGGLLVTGFILIARLKGRLRKQR